ncbi:MAG: hypothetical protein ACLPTF_02470 [Steroidobacteraceae bacterium]
MRSGRIVVVIDELNLHGVDPHTRPAIGAALERELTRLFAQQPAASYRAGEIAHVNTAPITLGGNLSGRTIGASVAQRVHGATSALSRSTKGKS